MALARILLSELCKKLPMKARQVLPEKTARSGLDLKEKPFPPLMSLESTLWTNFNTVLLGNGEIFSPTPVLHSRQ